MQKKYKELDELQKQMADRQARTAATEIAVNVSMSRDHESGDMHIMSELHGLNKEKMEAIHNGVMAVDFPYVLTQIYADDELRQQFEELVERLAKNRLYEIAGTIDEPRNVVRLTDI